MTGVFMEIKSLNTTQKTNYSATAALTMKNDADISCWGIDIQNRSEENPESENKETLAKLNNLLKTANSNIYYSKEKNTYYRWNADKNKFEKAKDIKEVLKTGYCQTKKGSFLAPDGELIVKNEYNSLQPQKEIGYNLPNVMASVYGLEKTGKKFVFLDKNDNSYKIWDNKTNSFVKSDIDDVTQGSYYKKGDKYFDFLNRPTTEEKFTANKNGYIELKTPGIYSDDKISGVYYKWNKETKTFEAFGPKIEEEKLLKEAPDGNISNIKQGEKDDCWLLSSLYGITTHNNAIFKDLIKVDDNGNTTVTLKGPQKEYTITRQELESAIKTQKYATGDIDTIAVEIAFEKFRKENIENNNISSNNFLSMYFLNMYAEENYLFAGVPRNAIEVLTGKKVTSLTSTQNDNYYLENNKLKQGKLDEATVNKHLENPNNLLILSLSEENSSSLGHAYVFKSQDKDYVYLIDPYDTTKTEKITKEDFYKRLLRVDFTDFSEPIDETVSKAKYLNLIK